MNKYRGPQRRVIFPRPLAGVEMALKIRRRARLRRKEASEFLRRLADEFGIAVPPDEGFRIRTEARAARPRVPVDEGHSGLPVQVPDPARRRPPLLPRAA